MFSCWHVRFGKGRVTGFTPPRIEVTFEDGAVRTFAYPQAVERFLSFENSEVQAQADRDLEQSEVAERQRELSRLLARRQQAEEDAIRRLEAMRERKAASARRTAARSAAIRGEKAGQASNT